MLTCGNIKYYLKQCSSPSHGQHCVMSGHTAKRRTRTLTLRGEIEWFLGRRLWSQKILYALFYRSFAQTCLITEK